MFGSESLSRRRFLQVVGVGAAAVGIGAATDAAALPPDRVKLLLTRGAGAMTDRGPDPVRVRQIVDRGIVRFTGAASVREAWQRFAGPSDVVGLHVNGIGQPTLITHPALVTAICAGLREAGVRENNIIIFDRSTGHLVGSGWTMNASKSGIRVMSCEETDWDPNAFVEVNGGKARFSTIVTKLCTKIINVRPLKHHGGTGISLCLKGMAFGMAEADGGKHHPDNCCPYIATAAASRWATEKLVLNIMDGLRPQVAGGPWGALEHQLNWDAIAFCTDPVALDFTAVGFLEALRKRRGLPGLWDNPQDNPKHILQAAERGAGVASAGRIDLQRMTI